MIYLFNSIPHGNYSGLPPEGQLVAIFVGLLLFLMGYGVYLTFGPGKVELRDQIDEHAKMHELGIAHGHSGNSESWKIAKGNSVEHNHETNENIDKETKTPSYI